MPKHLSEEHRRHISEALTGNEKLSRAIKERWKDPEFRKRMLEAQRRGGGFKEHRHSEETKRKISEILKEQFRKGREPWIKGRTKETDPILREATKKQSETRKRLFREGKFIPWNKGIPMSEEAKQKMIAKKVGVPSPRRGMSYEQQYGIEEAKIKRLKNSLAKRGANNPHWKGGSPIRYRQVQHDGKVMTEHRLIVERAFGRKLGFDEVVHHIDGDPKNNDPTNLLLMNRDEHTAFEWALHKDEVKREDAFQLGTPITLME